MQVEHKLENTPAIIRHGRKISNVEAEGYALHSTKKDLWSSHAVPSTQKKTQPTPPGKDDSEMENIRLQDKANMLSSKLHNVSKLLFLSNTNAEYSKTCLKAKTESWSIAFREENFGTRNNLAQILRKKQRQKLAEKEYQIIELKESLSQKTSETECLTKDILILHGLAVADRKKLEYMALENEKFGQDIILQGYSNSISNWSHPIFVLYKKTRRRTTSWARLTLAKALYCQEKVAYLTENIIFACFILYFADLVNQLFNVYNKFKSSMIFCGLKPLFPLHSTYV